MTILVNEMHVITGGSASPDSWISSVNVLFQFLSNSTVVAQQVSQPDFVGQVTRAWNHFFQTGQIWAMIIGIVIGFVLRGYQRT